MMAKAKSAKHRKETYETPAPPLVALRVGAHSFPVFDGLSAAFGARGRDYPDYGAIPDEYRNSGNRFARVFATLFYRGGQLSDFGLQIKSGVDRRSFYTTLRALMSSFDPKHEVKQATVAWLLAEHCEDIKQ